MLIVLLSSDEAKNCRDDDIVRCFCASVAMGPMTGIMVCSKNNSESVFCFRLFENQNDIIGSLLCMRLS